MTHRNHNHDTGSICTQRALIFYFDDGMPKLQQCNQWLCRGIKPVDTDGESKKTDATERKYAYRKYYSNYKMMLSRQQTKVIFHKRQY